MIHPDNRIKLRNGIPTDEGRAVLDLLETAGFEIPAGPELAGQVAAIPTNLGGNAL